LVNRKKGELFIAIKTIINEEIVRSIIHTIEKLYKDNNDFFKKDSLKYDEYCNVLNNINNF
jgi:predicted type IV restriction endonuclease